MPANEPSDGRESLLAGDSEGADRENRPFTPADLFRTLTKRRHRLVLYLLAERGGTVTLDELVERIVTWEADPTSRMSERERARAVRTDLHHLAMPKLADHGLATYHVDDEAVTFTREAEEIRPLLSDLMDQDDVDVREFLHACRRR